MHQTKLAILMSAVVICCPYLCLGELSDASSSGCIVASCNCTTDLPNGESPASPDGEDHDCLCHGAIMDIDSRHAHDTTEGPLANGLFDALVIEKTALIQGDEFAYERLHHYAPCCSGKDVCLLGCALLL